MDLTREQVIGHRIAAQQLDREPSSGRSLTDVAILDLGVQDSGRDGASWALANRGVPIGSPDALVDADDLALVWSLRVSPHYYRRAELVDVMTAVSPFDDADAGRRMIGAAKPVAAVGIEPREAIAHVAKAMRRLVTRPMVKGDLSTALTEDLPDAFGIECRPCQATHVSESLFRIAALFGGLEIEPATSPPVLRRIPDWPRRPAGGRRRSRGRAGAPPGHPRLSAAAGSGHSVRRRRVSWTRPQPWSSSTGPRMRWRCGSRTRRSGCWAMCSHRSRPSGCSVPTICSSRARTVTCWCRRPRTASSSGRRSDVPARCWPTARSWGGGDRGRRARSWTSRSSCGSPRR